MADGAEWQDLAKALALWLEGKGVLNFEQGVGGNTFTERTLPTTPDNAVGIRSYGGFEAPGRRAEDMPTIQVLARNKSAQAAIEQLWKVYSNLHNARYQTLPGGLYLLYAFAQQSGPVFVEVDGAGRYVYSTNYRLEVQDVTAQRGG